MRVLQVGYGNIGREVFRDYSLVIDDYMVVDLVQPIPTGHEWDSERVDLALLVVDTPSKAGSSDYDYTALDKVIRQYELVADFLLIKSTVSLDFLEQSVYVEFAERIGFSPEFYGATKFSSRDVLKIDWNVFTYNVPQWFQESVQPYVSQRMHGTAKEVIVSKLTENAFLATKVTFFHELAMFAQSEGIDFENVRQIVTADPRINDDHSFMEQPGWQSHCFDKDVPAFATLGDDLTLAKSMLKSNENLLQKRSYM